MRFCLDVHLWTSRTHTMVAKKFKFHELIWIGNRILKNGRQGRIFETYWFSYLFWEFKWSRHLYIHFQLSETISDSTDIMLQLDKCINSLQCAQLCWFERKKWIWEGQVLRLTSLKNFYFISRTTPVYLRHDSARKRTQRLHHAIEQVLFFVKSKFSYSSLFIFTNHFSSYRSLKTRLNMLDYYWC